MNGRDLTLPTRAQPSQQKYSDLAAINGRQRRTHATLPKAFHKEPGRMLSRGRQSMWRRLWHISRFLKILLEIEMGSVLLRPDENRTGFHSGLIQIFRGVYFHGTRQRKCWLFDNSQKVSRAACLRPLCYTGFYCYDLIHPHKISTQHRVGPRKSVSNRAPHLPTPALCINT